MLSLKRTIQEERQISEGGQLGGEISGVLFIVSQLLCQELCQVSVIFINLMKDMEGRQRGMYDDGMKVWERREIIREPLEIVGTNYFVVGWKSKDFRSWERKSLSFATPKTLFPSRFVGQQLDRWISKQQTRKLLHHRTK